MQRILIPLDGTKEAEKAVSISTELCREGDFIVLLQVIKPEASAQAGSIPGKRVRGGFAGLSGGVQSLVTPDVPVYVETVDQAFERQTNEAKDYLETLAGPFHAKGIASRIEVVTDEHPGDAIVKYARTMKPTLIAMSHKARFSLVELLPGHVANQVVQSEVAPVLLVPSGS